MSATDKPYEAYVYSLREQVEQHLAALDELSDDLRRGPLSFKDRNSAERSLQILVEAAIGCSKHYLKSLGKPVPSEARATVERVYEIETLQEPPIEIMRGAIGMRNAIVHDYLNLDWAVITPVMTAQKYHQVANYITLITKKLLA